MQLLEIGEGCFHKTTNDFVIENYPNLEKIVVKNKSLQNLSSFNICNNEKLKTIEIKDNTLSNVKNVIIESILEIIILYLYLPNLQSFKTGKESLYNTTGLSLSGNFIRFDVSNYIFLIYNH